jgi:S1-C subfamily serine protease
MSEQLRSSIARIHDRHGNVVGVGFLVTEREILTCAHVLAQALGIREDTSEQPENDIQLDFPLAAPGEMLTAQVILWHPVGTIPKAEEDIAVLKLERDAPAEAQAVRLVTSKTLWGHPFRALGFPVGYDQGVWASGRLLDRDATGWVQIEDVKETGFRVQPGFSGGPVWDEEVDGVVGMIVAAEQRPEIKAAFVIPVDLLDKAWPALGERANLHQNHSEEDGTEMKSEPEVEERKALEQELARLEKILENHRTLLKRIEVMESKYVEPPLELLNRKMAKEEEIRYTEEKIEDIKRKLLP